MLSVSGNTTGNEMKRDIETEEQSNLFDEWTKLTADFYNRHQSIYGAVAYEEIEWEAFQEGWNAAKKHFEVTK